jgi:uridylate kinase
MTADSAVEMQIQLDNFSEYCSLWKLNVNSSKTKVVIFAGGRFPTNNFNLV